MSKYFHTVITNEGIVEIPFTSEEEAVREEQELEYTWIGIRIERDKKLQETDVLVLPDRWMRYAPEKQQA